MITNTFKHQFPC